MALALLAVGLVKGINLVTFLGCLALALWGLNAVLVGRGLRGLRGQRRLPHPIFAGTPASVTLEVIGPHRTSLAAVRLDDRGPDHQFAWFVPQLRAGQALRFAQDVTLPARGRYAWGVLAATCGYPFGLLQRRVILAPAEEILVLPRLGRLHAGRLRRFLRPAAPVAERTARGARRHASARTEFHGLRAFRSGDSPRWIHWRTSARCGELMVREFEAPPTDDLIVVLDPFVEDGRPSDADLDAAVSFAATVCWERCRQRGDRLVLALAGTDLVMLDGVTGPEHALRLLECLAVVGPGQGAAPNTDALAVRLAGRGLPAASVLVVSAGRGGLAEALARRLRRPAAGVNARALDRVDFYERPPGQAAQETGRAP
jgi:uncharacterized protein (DUF58 family)